MSAIAVGEITIIDLHDEDVHIGTTAPVDLKDGRLWLDTSTVPNIMKRWDAATQKWIKASPTEASDIGAETPSGAQDKADGAEDAAKTYAGGILKDLADGDYVGGTFIDGKSVISPTVIGLQGTFADLLAGDPFGARLELGEDDGEPFLEAYDDDELRVKLLQDSLEFLARGLTGGKLEAEYFGAGGQSVAGLLLSSDYSIKMQAAYYAWMETYGAAVQCAGESVGIWADAGIGLLAPRIDISGDLHINNDKASSVESSGSVSFGSWIRWSDGRAMCWGTKEIGSVAITSAAGSVYYNFGGLNMGGYPITFTSRPAFASFVYGATDHIVWQGGVKVQPGTTTLLPRIYVLRHAAATIDVMVDWVAIGWWK